MDPHPHPEHYYEPDVDLELFDPPYEELICHCGVPFRLHNSWQEGHSFTPMRLPKFVPYWTSDAPQPPDL
jgi:hypothetical protein